VDQAESNLPGLIGIIVFILFIAIFYAGAAKKIVIYYDYKDLFSSIGALLCLFFFFAILQESPTESERSNKFLLWVVTPLLGLLSLYLLLLNFKNSVMHNRSLPLGCLIGIFKLAYVILAFTIIFAQFSDAKDRRRSFGDVIVAALIVGVAVWITTVLVNGKEVYKQKGWPLPAGI
jgi:hypothetical protein